MDADGSRRQCRGTTEDGTRCERLITLLERYCDEHKDQRDGTSNPP